MNDWQDSTWREYRHFAEELESCSLSAEGLPESVLEQLATTQWVHALLRTRGEQLRDASRRSGRVDAVMQRVTQPQQVAKPHRRAAVLRWGTLVLAATLLLSLLVTNWPSSPDAVAQVRRMQAAMRDDTPREYDVRIELESLVRQRHLEGTLTVRGGRKFVFECGLPLGGELILGADGQSAWGVPPVGPVVLSNDPNRLDRWTERLPVQVSPHILSMDTVLARMATDYALEYTTSTEENRRSVRGVRKPEAPARFPDEVIVTADPDTGIVQTLVMKWNRDSLLPRPKRVTLTFRKTIELGDDWFGHERHHEPSRPVVSLEDQPASTTPESDEADN